MYVHLLFRRTMGILIHYQTILSGKESEEGIRLKNKAVHVTSVACFETFPPAYIAAFSCRFRTWARVDGPTNRESGSCMQKVAVVVSKLASQVVLDLGSPITMNSIIEC